MGGDLGTLEVFKKYHASLDARDSLGNTPALWALYEGMSKMCVALLKAGSNPDIKNATGVSVSSVAREYKIEEIVSWLDSRLSDS